VAGQVAAGPAGQGGTARSLAKERGGWFGEGGIGSLAGSVALFYVGQGWSYGEIAQFLDDLIRFP
jgi:hypothetical protein